jgi:hypothetical protein
MTQQMFNEENASFRRTKAVKFADDSSSADGDGDTDTIGDSVRIVQSIGSGQIYNNTSDHNHQPLSSPSSQQETSSWSDIHTFLAQTRAEQTALLDRLESLEATLELNDAWDENNLQRVGTTTTTGGIDGIDDHKENESRPRRKSSIARRKAKPWKYMKYPLPESTYTFLITEKIVSLPYLVGIVTTAGSLMCLGITLKNELDNATSGNPYGLPPGVPNEVRIAQFLGIIIGELTHNIITHREVHSSIM